jgi:hypothetical protein
LVLIYTIAFLGCQFPKLGAEKIALGRYKKFVHFSFGDVAASYCVEIGVQKETTVSLCEIIAPRTSWAESRLSATKKKKKKKARLMRRILDFNPRPLPPVSVPQVHFQFDDFWRRGALRYST